MTVQSQANDTEAAEARLEAVKRKRGYLMPHHGLLALTAPELLEGYDACYTALTLGDRYLAERDKEFVWLGILAVKEEFLATQHVAKFLNAGGNPRHVSMAVRMAAYAQGATAFEFADTYWNVHVPGLDAKQHYMTGLFALLEHEPIDGKLLHMAMAAIHTSIRQWTPLEWHIAEAYALGADENHLAEALSYSMFTGSIPNFIEGCEVWRQMITKEQLDASEPFRLWASIDQSGPV